MDQSYTVCCISVGRGFQSCTVASSGYAGSVPGLELHILGVWCFSSQEFDILFILVRYEAFEFMNVFRFRLLMRSLECLSIAL